MGLRLALGDAAELSGDPLVVVGSVEICPHAQLTHAANVNLPQSQSSLATAVDGDATAASDEDAATVRPRAPCQALAKGIETLSPKAVDRFEADAWLMSPPCQPFTRQGKQAQGDDARCAALSHITDVLLPRVKRRPRLVYVENVLGFERSAARDRLAAALVSIGLTRITEHLWNPAGELNAGDLPAPGVGQSADDAAAAASTTATAPWPNSRLRYYMVAVPGVPANSSPPDGVPPFRSAPIRPLPQRLTLPASALSVGHVISAWHAAAETLSRAGARPPLGKIPLEELRVPDRTLCRQGKLFDIVTAAATRTNCFTKNYGRKVEGAGSVLLPEDQADRLVPVFAAHDPEACAAAGGACTLRVLGLRYFEPYEVAALLGFPPDFRFPPSLPARQRWALMGNSVNPLAVAHVLAPFAQRLLSSASVGEQTTEDQCLAACGWNLDP